MGEKSEQKKQMIVETARKIFSEKGFCRVTMKDIVDACQISRGGLYLYFDSTASLFEEILRQEEAETDDVFSNALGEDATILDVLLVFLKEQKREILRDREDLSVATYEYYFHQRPTPEKDPLRERFEAAASALMELIEAGVRDGEFYCEDAAAAASNIMFVLEGLRVSSHTMRLTDEMVDRELMTIVHGLAVE